MHSALLDCDAVPLGDSVAIPLGKRIPREDAVEVIKITEGDQLCVAGCVGVVLSCGVRLKVTPRMCEGDGVSAVEPF